MAAVSYLRRAAGLADTVAPRLQPTRPLFGTMELFIADRPTDSRPTKTPEKVSAQGHAITTVTRSTDEAIGTRRLAARQAGEAPRAWQPVPPEPPTAAGSEAPQSRQRPTMPASVSMASRLAESKGKEAEARPSARAAASVSQGRDAARFAALASPPAAQPPKSEGPESEPDPYPSAPTLVPIRPTTPARSMRGPNANGARTAYPNREPHRPEDPRAIDRTPREVLTVELGETRGQRPLPKPPVESPRRSARGEAPGGAGNLVRIGTIEVNVLPAAAPSVIVAPPIERAPRSPLARGYDSTFGLRQG